VDKLITKKLKTLSVLYVEDEAEIRMNIADTLSFYVKEVIQAKDGKDGLKLYKQRKPDIIISDILMPVMDGIEMVQKIRLDDKKTPIVMITAHTETDYLLSAVKLHLEQYLVKPVSLPDILESLHTCIEKISSNHAIVCDLPKGYHYDFDHKLLTYEKIVIKLKKKEIQFFELLLENTQRVVTYEELQEFVWGDRVMTDNGLRSVVKKKKKKLPVDIITNLSGVEYKLKNT